MRLLGPAVKSSAIALLAGEIPFWSLLFGYLIFIRPLIHEPDDMTPLIIFLFLGFVIRPAIAGSSALLLLSYFFKRPTWNNQANVTSAIKLSPTFGLTLAVVIAGSILLSAIEAGGLSVGIIEMYRLFIH